MTDDASGTDPTRPPGGRSWRIPILAGGLVLVIVVAVAVAVGLGNDEDDGTDLSADPTATSTPSPSSSTSPSDSPSPSPSDSATPTNGDPTPSPVINKAVKAAMNDGFPALIPSGVPAGWTVQGADYSAASGGSWQFTLTTPEGATVSLVQTTASVEDLVAQHLGTDAQSTGKVDLEMYGTGVWKGYSSGTGAGIAKKISKTSALVYGPDQDTVVTLAQELLTAEDADIPEAG
jgi:hypothetical protein